MPNKCLLSPCTPLSSPLFISSFFSCCCSHSCTPRFFSLLSYSSFPFTTSSFYLIILSLHFACNPVSGFGTERSPVSCFFFFFSCLQGSFCHCHLHRSFTCFYCGLHSPLMLLLNLVIYHFLADFLVFSSNNCTRIYTRLTKQCTGTCGKCTQTHKQSKQEQATDTVADCVEGSKGITGQKQLSTERRRAR